MRTNHFVCSRYAYQSSLLYLAMRINVVAMRGTSFNFISDDNQVFLPSKVPAVRSLV